MNTSTNSAHQARPADALTAAEFNMLRDGSQTIHVEVDTALGLLHLLHTATALDADAYVLVNAATTALQKIGLVNQRMDNVIHPGNLDEANATDWMNVRGAWGESAAPAQATGEGV